jgi:hypothetical protein
VTKDGVSAFIEWLVVPDLLDEEELDIIIQAGGEVSAVAVFSP